MIIDIFKRKKWGVMKLKYNLGLGLLGIVVGVTLFIKKNNIKLAKG